MSLWGKAILAHLRAKNARTLLTHCKIRISRFQTEILEIARCINAMILGAIYRAILGTIFSTSTRLI